MLSSPRCERYQILNYCPSSKPGSLQTIFVLCQMAFYWANRRCQRVCVWLVEEGISSYGSASSLEKQQLLPIVATESSCNFSNMLLLQFFSYVTLYPLKLYNMSTSFHYLSSLYSSYLWPFSFTFFFSLFFYQCHFNLYKPIRVFHIHSLCTCNDTNILLCNYILKLCNRKMSFPLDIFNNIKELLFALKMPTEGLLVHTSV